jgi:hypothetical protein
MPGLGAFDEMAGDGRSGQIQSQMFMSRKMIECLEGN